MALSVSCAAGPSITNARVSPYLKHETLTFQETIAIREGSRYETFAIVPDTVFHEALVSWNVEVPGGAGFVVELCVRQAGQTEWSPWLQVGEWGVVDSSVDRLTDFANGKIDVDYFTSTIDFDAIRVRFDAEGSGDLVLKRFDLCLTGADENRKHSEPRSPGGTIAMEVPRRSQRISNLELGSRICSPTSVAMVMEYRGVTADTVEVANRLYDQPHDIYGNWTRAIQGAFSFGVPGYLTRFSDWKDVERVIASGQPLIASIRVPKSGLTGAPYVATTGHLLVIVGFDDAGNLIVNDPAAGKADVVRRVYRRDEMEQAWMGKGGVAYVLLEP